MSRKRLKTVRRTVVVTMQVDDVPVASRVLEWESRARTGRRVAHRVEWAGPSVDGYGGAAYLLDLEITCKGANRHDFTKFVRTYLPEAYEHFITE